MNSNDIIINALNPTFEPTFSVTDMPSAVIIINPTSFPTSLPTHVTVDLNTDNTSNKKEINIYIYISLSMFFIISFISILYNKYVNSKKKKKHFKLTDRPNLNNINTINFTDLTIQTNEAIV